MFTMNMGHMLNQSEIARRYAEYDSISTEGLLKTDEEIAKEQQQAQQQMAQQQAQESIAGETGGIVRDAAKQPAQPQQGGM
jgi:hypothetical protein